MHRSRTATIEIICRCLLCAVCALSSITVHSTDTHTQNTLFRLFCDLSDKRWIVRMCRYRQKNNQAESITQLTRYLNEYVWGVEAPPPARMMKQS